jgi:hypothetical protein
MGGHAIHISQISEKFKSCLINLQFTGTKVQKTGRYFLKSRKSNAEETSVDKLSSV